MQEVVTDREAELLAAVPNRLFIDGEWIDAASSGMFAVRDPATGHVVREVADATAEDAIRALDAAVAAQDGWAETAPRSRSEILRRTWELVEEHADDLALLMTVEMGKPLAESYGEVTYGGEFLRWFSEEAVRIHGRYGFDPEGTGQMIVSRRPVGPSFLVTPWNFPFAMATRKIGPALAVGCTVVIKPSQLTPLTTLYFTRLLAEAGLPAGVVNVVTSASSSRVAEPIIADPRLRKLSFTGSTEVGRTLIAQAAGNVLRVSMELGGNAPFVVFDDADLDKAVEGALAAKFRNIGQACTAAHRFIVHERVAEDFATRITAIGHVPPTLTATPRRLGRVRPQPLSHRCSPAYTSCTQLQSGKPRTPGPPARSCPAPPRRWCGHSPAPSRASPRGVPPDAVEAPRGAPALELRASADAAVQGDS
ncbi:aldehyde dehydrogenase family protein [Nocardia abscessus]|uniref:aldehyde dehydrogenase family protein n=1 Tax=Nocardia abscessus TaxID=120957 RepID=UPI0002ED1789|nr:aldehyde dehydrogenase family protein [Nocardia abscessus]MCC3332211.1 aldehyde dehydrogenase family protein [Nocardia abscessus]